MRIGVVRTYTGRMVDVRNPDPETIDPRDIAHQLSLENRWNGATRRPYSVAEHCVWVAKFASRMVRPEQRDLATTWGLLHDAHEAYIKDIPTPLKLCLTSDAYSEAADALDRVIVTRFGIATKSKPIVSAIIHAVKKADAAALWCENEVLLTPVPGLGFSGMPDPALLKAVPMLDKLAERVSHLQAEQDYYTLLCQSVKMLSGRW